MADLQGEVQKFWSELGFNKISTKEIGDDSTESPKERRKKSPKKAKGHQETKSRKQTEDVFTPERKIGKNRKEASPVAKQRDKPSISKEKKHKRHTADSGSGVTGGSEDGPVNAGRGAGKRPRPRRKRSEPAVQVPEVSSSEDAEKTATGGTTGAAAGGATSAENWYQHSVTNWECPPVEASLASQLQQEASAMLSQAAKDFKNNGAGVPAGQWSWTQTVLTSGTVSDKLAARQALLRVRPHLGLHWLEDTVRMVTPKGKGHAMQAMSMLTDLFVKHLLPPERKLKMFSQQPLGALQSTTLGDPAKRKRQLMFWLFEERLKRVYRDFVSRVKEMSHDTVEKTRKQAVNTLGELLVSHPEMEQMLLETLVNKLGDEKKVVACLAVRRLGSVLRAHPAMRTVVVKEVERILFRQNVGKRVQFYGVSFLSQVQFSDEGDEPLAQRIVGIYVGFFRACVKQAELDARLMRALLTGLSACAGRARLVADQLQRYLDPLHHIVHLAGFGVATQALLLMFRLSTGGGRAEPTDRFYCALYKKLIHPGLATSQKIADFLNLVYRAVRMDSNEPRARAFIKRLLQCCLHQTAALACSVLLLVSELFRHRPQLAAIAGSQGSAWEDEEEDEEERPRDVPLPEDEDEDGAERTSPSPASAAAAATPGWQFVAGRPGAGRRRYDPLYREPRWCRAERAPLLELAPLARHAHPSVALFAAELAAARSPAYSGNPLHDFQIMHFLNRFCYKNPKKSGQTTEAARTMPVTAPGYAKLADSQVPLDERFFHRYFRWRAEHAPAPAPSDRKSLTDASGDVTDEAFDDFLDGFFSKKGGDSVDFMTEIAEGADEALEEIDAADDEDEGQHVGLEDEDDFEDMEDDMEDDFVEDSDFEEEQGPPKKKAKGIPALGRSKKSKGGGDVTDLFASAEEFSELLEEGAEDADGSSQASSRADKAGRRQLQWEEGGSGKRPRQGAARDFRARKDHSRGKGKRAGKRRK